MLTGRTVIVCGGRDYSDRAKVFSVLDEAHRHDPIGLVMHGACGWDASKPNRHVHERLRGADRWADEWATEMQAQEVAADVPCLGILRRPADWSKGRKGGPLRNQAMLDEAMELWVGFGLQVIAFPGGAGTAGMVRIARAAGVDVLEVRP